MAFGVTAAGFVRKLATDIVNSLSVSYRARIGPNLQTRNEKTFIGNHVAITADETAQVWEAIESAYYQFDPDNADENGLIGIGKLTGLSQNPASKGLVTATVGLDAGQNKIAGDLVAHVIGDPDNTWTNRDAVTSVDAGSYDVVFESVNASSEATAAPGTLTVIATPTAGWNSITNSDEATPGTDIESLDAFRVRREIGLSVQGSGSAAGIAADVVQVEGVRQVRVFENRTKYDTADIPAHGIRVVVWSGSPSAADYVEITEAIYQSKDASTPTVGSNNDIKTDANSEPETIRYDDPTETSLTIGAQIRTDTGLTEQEVKDVLLAAYESKIGTGANYEKLRCAVVGMTNVTEVSVFTVNGGVVNIDAAKDEILTLEEANITVSING